MWRLSDASLMGRWYERLDSAGGVDDSLSSPTRPQHKPSLIGCQTAPVPRVRALAWQNYTATKKHRLKTS